MAQDNKNTTNLAQVIAANSGGGGNQSPEMNQLVTLLNRKLARELDEEDEAREQHARARKANAENMVLVQEQDKLKQSSCSHIKPRGLGSALAGQRTHRGWITLVCQYCGKQFSDPPQSPDQKIPPGIFPDMATIGGPQN